MKLVRSVQRLLIILCFLQIATNDIIGQNLIPNGSFEQCKNLSNRWITSRIGFEKAIHHWSSPIDGSPDILFDKVLANMFPVRPNVNVAEHLPYEGRVMIGLKTYGCGYNTQHCKEYLQVGLVSPLLPNETYLFSAQGQLLKDCVATGALGVVVVKDSLWRYGAADLFDLSSTICNMDSPAANGWQQLTLEITPQDTMHYLLFGNFLPDSLVEVRGSSEAPVPYTYWLLDDMKLVEKNRLPQKIMTIKDVGFDFNESALSMLGQEAVAKIAREIMANGVTDHLRIQGHTDDVGSAAYNQALSLLRAQSVAELLKQLGVENHISVEGYGETKPLVENDTDNNRKMNRRVEIYVDEE